MHDFPVCLFNPAFPESNKRFVCDALLAQILAIALCLSVTSRSIDTAGNFMYVIRKLSTAP